MLYKILFILLSFNLSICIGLKALIIPQSASILSTSGTGISYSHEINPALLLESDSYLSLSKNSWLAGVSGQKISYIFDRRKYISFENLSINDIELRDEIATEEPLGFFGANWYAAEINESFDLSFYENITFGYKVKLNYSKLYTESMHGYSIDIGLNNQINKNLNIGLLIKNLGREYSNNLRVDNDILLGFGMSYHMPDLKLILLSDYLVYNQNNLLKFSTITTLPYLNFIIGGTYSELYKDLSFGIKLDYKKWAFIFGNLNHNNQVLSNPSSVEIRKIF
ncbi:MAG: hypothetical protein CMG14_03395 [Candidatus Marinimicrobia bacterium]|nr:hypothetical protein [Candidatus Neomarinimicrobiota bacterium]|tara:strand:+ start:6144 stop:6986 length:843 start_codon:yes stop_codon:yes gene_type:complete